MRAFLSFAFLLAGTASLAQTRPAAPAVPQPQVDSGRSVHFRYTAPVGTARVDLSLEGVKPLLPMAKGADGAWTLTVPDMAPEIYFYHFEVDGRSELDSRNLQIVYSTTSVANSFLVPGVTPQPWETQDIPHGTLHRHLYTTHIALNYDANQSEFDVYTPPGYDPHAATKYPVLYLLHGWSHQAGDWSGFGHADEVLDALIHSGQARPMIVVMPSGYGDRSFLRTYSVWNDPAIVEHNTSLFSAALLTEVIPQVERLYSVSARREDRAIAGLSMGGLESVTIGLAHPELFAYVGGMSAAVHLVEPAAIKKLDGRKADLKLLWIACGTADDLIGANRRLVAELTAAGYNVVSPETKDGMHTWIVWRGDLTRFLPLLFQRR